jgi:hypothetical protein
VFAKVLLPNLERLNDAGIELPRSRLHRLVLVETKEPVLEIDLLPPKVVRLRCRSTPFSSKKPVRETNRERDVGAREEHGVF